MKLHQQCVADFQGVRQQRHCTCVACDGSMPYFEAHSTCASSVFLAVLVPLGSLCHGIMLCIPLSLLHLHGEQVSHAAEGDQLAV